MTAVEDFEDERPVPALLSWARAAGIVVTAVGRLFGVVAMACDDAVDALASHAAYRADRKHFVDSVTSDIGHISAGRLA